MINASAFQLLITLLIGWLDRQEREVIGERSDGQQYAGDIRAYEKK